MSFSRRGVLAVLLVLLTPSAWAHPGPHRHPHGGPRRRIRRRVMRRRIRRAVLWRTVGGRRLLFVPLAVAVGWELLVDDKVVVVKEVHTHHIVVEHSDGTTQKLDVKKEDTKENKKDLEGSEYEVEIEEEVD
jgi:hypothetical protein